MIKIVAKNYVKETNKPGFAHDESSTYYLTLRTQTGTTTKEFPESGTITVSCNDFNGDSIIIPKLYRKDTQIENLVAVAPVIGLNE